MHAARARRATGGAPRPSALVVRLAVVALLLSLLTPLRPAAAAPTVTLLAPGDGASFAPTDAPVFTWSGPADATAYQVVFGSGERAGPWVTEEAWHSGSLPPGGYRWHVVAKRGTEVVVSGEASFTVSEAGTMVEDAPLPSARQDAPLPLAQDAPRKAKDSEAPADAGDPVTLGAPNAPVLALATGSAVGGMVLTLYGAGFAPGEAVELRWRVSGRPGMEQPLAGESGAWSTAILVPDVPGGVETLDATGTASGRVASAPLTILPAIGRDPAGGPPGSEIVVTASGFGADEEITVRLGSNGAVLGSDQTDETGRARLKVVVPQADPGVASLVADGTTSGLRAEGSLRIDPAGSGDGETDTEAPDGATLEQVGVGRGVGPGAFAVAAAPVGAVGGGTASGHVVLPADRYASLPVCTTTSCPWLDPGTTHPVWGTRIECGDACLVRAESAETGRCTVAPVLDTGPWFSGDDWWNPAAGRRVNRRPSAVVQLAQGYPAAQAARDGYDLGFGRSAAGVGISDLGYEVGNPAGVGLGPGAWADLGLDPGQGVADVVVTLLWLSGDDPAAAAAECAAQSAPTPEPTEPAPTATPSPEATPGPAGTGETASTPTPEPATAPAPPATADDGPAAEPTPAPADEAPTGTPVDPVPTATAEPTPDPEADSGSGEGKSDGGRDEESRRDERDRERDHGNGGAADDRSFIERAADLRDRYGIVPAAGPGGAVETASGPPAPEPAPPDAAPPDAPPAVEGTTAPDADAPPDDGAPTG